jgi:hypothetical protein
MDTLALKLLLTPALIGGASLVGRRWGPAVSGWLVGVPFTSGPITLVLALTHGVGFAEAAAAGTLAGTISQAGFCVTYAWLAGRCGWLLAAAGSTLVFAGLTAALRPLPLPAGPLFLATIPVIVLALRVLPASGGAEPGAPAALPRWDLPARIAVATGFVVLLTGVAPALGPRLTGLLAPFPLYGAVLAGFAHALQEPAQATLVLKGLLLGLFTFAGFFLMLATLLQRAGIGPAFGAAILTGCVLQGGSLWWLRRSGRR